jgi:hypothetical protein
MLPNDFEAHSRGDSKRTRLSSRDHRTQSRLRGVRLAEMSRTDVRTGHGILPQAIDKAGPLQLFTRWKGGHGCCQFFGAWSKEVDWQELIEENWDRRGQDEGVQEAESIDRRDLDRRQGQTCDVAREQGATTVGQVR